MIEAVIFDMDGVILDSEPIHYKVEKAIMNENGHDFEFEDHTKYVGQTTRDLWDDICSKYYFKDSAEMLTIRDNGNYLNELKNGNTEPIEGVIDLIKLLYDSGVKLIVASSAVRDNIEVVMSRFDIKEYFRGYVSGQDVRKTKPNPEIFLKAADKLDVSPDRCVVIEDASHGVEAAKSAGMTCIAFRNLNSGNQNLQQADVIVDSISEITLDLIESLLLKTQQS